MSNSLSNVGEEVSLNDILNIPRVRVVEEAPQKPESDDLSSSSSRRVATQRDLLPATPSRELDPRFLIVLDAENVALRHGKDMFFSVRGLEIARDFFQVRGHRVIGFVPTYVLDDRNWAAKWSVIKKKLEAGVKPAKKDNYSKVPDDLKKLQELHMEGIICTTPGKDYSDSYTIEYAMKKGGIVVTNDMFRDAMEKPMDLEERRKKELWLHTHCMSFTFIGDDFLPNPDFVPPTYDE